jgi:DNA invertase Pin-like site-specific DNA recombinase/flagellar motility protein MotE (MotC chaperone)
MACDFGLPPTGPAQPQVTQATATPLAYSYVRFSTPEQAKGASYERQIELAQAYARDRGWELAETTYKDLGVSAYRHKNAETGALRAFLNAVEQGGVPPGSYLLVESLDRVTRNSILDAQALFLLIINSGITLVTLLDRREYSRESVNANPTELIVSIAIMMRGHEESATKSRRATDAYDRKRKAAAERTENGKPFTRMLPAWLTWNNDTRRHEAILERAAVVRRIFEFADQGLGQQAIAQRLNAEGVPRFGPAEAWHRTYVQNILTNSAVVGTFTPRQRRKDAQGNYKRLPLDPVEEYFPSIIDRDLFERVANRVRTTAPRRRNAGVGPKSIFAGLLRCAHCGGTVARIPKGDNKVYLICSRANRRLGCKHQVVRYEAVEHALLVNATLIMQEAPRGKETAEIDQEIANLDTLASMLADETRELVDELIKSNAKRTALREKERELEQTRERLRTLRARGETLAKPYVQRRLQTLEQALTRKPLNIVQANKALKEAVSRVVINPESAELLLHWHHAPDQPTDAGPFASQHMTAFDVVPGGYVYRDRGKGSKEG